MRYRFFKAVCALFKEMGVGSLMAGFQAGTVPLMKEMGLDWIDVNTRHGMGDDGIVVSPCYDGRYPLKDVLRRRVPFKFLLILKLKHPFTPLFVRGLITQSEIRGEVQAFEEMWGTDG